MKLIVGLGNPGEMYDTTRHNLGFEVVNTMLHKFGLTDEWQAAANFKSLICKYKGEGEELLFAKPQTFMNSSGIAVRLLADFYKIEPKDIVIIHDDIDLKLGQLKVRHGGSSAGHKGVESVIEKLGSDEFIRFRLGIAPDEHHGAVHVEKFVISDFDAHEKSKIKHLVKRSILALDILLKEGIESTQNQFN